MEAIPTSSDVFKGVYRQHMEGCYTSCSYSMKDLHTATSSRNRTLWKKSIRNQLILDLLGKDIKISGDLTFSTSEVCFTATTAHTANRSSEFRTVNDAEDNVERDIIKPENSALLNAEASLTADPTFQHTDIVTQYNITDTDDKHFVLRRSGDNVQLTAKHLQGDNIKLAEVIIMNYFTSRPVPGNNNTNIKSPVTLSLLGKNSYLCCVDKELRLKEVGSIKDLDQKDLKPFIFLTNKNFAESSVTFESAKAPGYYISTSTREEEVKLSESQSRTRNFKLFKF
ncbi:uncharacterized protein LOC108711579 [Xenopus laevis]|uniref:Interleukin-1 n=2 Tax=Xenopus laevis TaxID=8355 RepID=A0A974DF76_XENLA|nr:uncharacterized protein LOC108711579 [Xenopus laevis]OCT90000.1 hypothetical protein XELAEV_18018615mg [Xenopus laevis]